MDEKSEMITFKDKSDGSVILKKNKFFRDLTNIMKNNDFRSFHDEYFKNWSDIETMIFFMRLYSTVEIEYKNRFNEPISDELMAFMLHKIMNNRNTRSIAITLFKNFQEDEGYSKTKNFRNLLDFKK